MRKHLLAPFLLAMLACIPGEARAPQSTANVPWSPEVRCVLNPTNDKGLHPKALSALRGIAVAHRVTQGINHSVSRGNVHDTDGMIDGKPYTGAADVSVRCLTAGQIKALLDRLGSAGFAAWYRKPGEDDWSGPPHIHAVWAGCSLKPVLQQQVKSWLEGRNGLGSDRPYQFWQASSAIKEKVQTLFRASNP